MANLDISVVIPTYNRKELLARTLELFNHQTCPKDKFEVVVVDDGSSDGTQDAVEQLRPKLLYRLNYLKVEKKGPASARNRGVKAAGADIIFFTGDDIFPHRDLIKHHLVSHERYPDMAVLGFVGWSKELKVTDFMSFVSPDGLQFRYGNIKDRYNCGFRHFYTSNISLNKKWFKEDVFDEGFYSAILEDTELGYRLEKKGLKILYNPEAIGYHYHILDFESFCQRMKRSGFFAVLLAKKHPELRFRLLIFSGLFSRAISGMLKIISPLARIFNRKFYWQCRLLIFYFQGIREGRHSLSFS